MGRHTWAVFLLYFLGQLTVGQEMSEKRFSLDERVFAASKVFALLQLHCFRPKTETAPDLDSSYRSYLRKILATDDRLQFDLATIEFGAQVHNGHTFFWDAWLDKSNDQALGFYAMPLDGKWVVQTSFFANLKPGDTISNIDDTAIEAFFLQQQRYVSASSTTAQRHNLFLFPYLFPEQFTLTLQDSRKVTVNRTALTTPPEKTEGHWMKPGTIAYIRIPSFFDSALEGTALMLMRQFHAANVLIIDVRNNTGGITPVRLILALMDRPYHGWVESSSIRSRSPNADEGGAIESHSVSNATGNSSGDPKSTLGNRLIMPSPYAFRES